MSPWRRHVFFKIQIDGVSDAQSKDLTAAVCAMDLPNEFCKAHLPSDLELAFSAGRCRAGSWNFGFSFDVAQL